MIRKAIVKVQKDDKGAFIEFPSDWDIDLSKAVWVVEDEKFVIHLDGPKCRRDAWYDAITKLENELGRLPDEDWAQLSNLIRKPNKTS